MKKLITLLLCLAMTLAIAACGNAAPAADTTGNAGGSTKEEPAVSSGEKIQYSYCVHTASGFMDEAMELFAERLSELSDGRFVATSYTPGTMGNEAELVDAVLMGDMTFSTPADTLTFQATGLYDWGSLPGLVTSAEEANKYLLSQNGHMSQMINEQFAEKGIVRLAGLDNGFRCIASTKPVETLKDIQGLKTRVANVPLMMGLYSGAGIQSTVIDSSETMTALQQGTVDAVENSFVNLANQGYIDLCDKVLAINFIYSSRSIVCNADWFNALSAEDQELVRQAAQEAADYANGEFSKQYEELLNDSRWTVYDLSDEQYAAFQASADKLWDSARADCDPAILDALLAGKN